MLTTFNCGIGMVVVVDTNLASDLVTIFKKNKEKVYEIGEITALKQNTNQLTIKNIEIPWKN